MYVCVFINSVICGVIPQKVDVQCYKISLCVGCNCPIVELWALLGSTNSLCDISRMFYGFCQLLCLPDSFLPTGSIQPPISSTQRICRSVFIAEVSVSENGGVSTLRFACQLCYDVC